MSRRRKAFESYFSQLYHLNQLCSDFFSLDILCGCVCVQEYCVPVGVFMQADVWVGFV